MKLRLINCDPNRRREIRAAINFYAQKLFSDRMMKHLDFRIEFVPDMKRKRKLLGEIYAYSQKRKRRFAINIAQDTSLKSQLMSIAHEMAHARQYARNEMIEIGKHITRWHDKKIVERSIVYWDRPWEIDARGWETGLYVQWRLVKKKLLIDKTSR